MNQVKALLRACMKRLLPDSWFQKLIATRSRRLQLKYFRERGFLDRVDRHIEEHGTVVQSGPFAGMIYPIASARSRWSLPKLLGSYESELHPFLRIVAKRNYDCIIDIGSAEGYYAAGLARMFNVPLHAYDPEPFEKNFSAQMAERNHVSHLVKMYSHFTVDDMRRFASKRALVLCDCEGFEEVLFRPENLGLTLKWDLIIELHDTADKVLPRLNWPQTIVVVDSLPKSGAHDEIRQYPQRFLLCDSQPSASAVRKEIL